MFKGELIQLMNDVRDGVEPEHMDRLIRIAWQLCIDTEQYEYYFERWGVSIDLFMELYRKCVQSVETH